MFEQQFQSVQTKFLHYRMWQNSPICRRPSTAWPQKSLGVILNFNQFSVFKKHQQLKKVPVPKSQGSEESSLTLCSLEVSCLWTQLKNLEFCWKNKPNSQSSCAFFMHGCVFDWHRTFFARHLATSKSILTCCQFQSNIKCKFPLSFITGLFFFPRKL